MSRRGARRRSLRVLVLVHHTLVPPDCLDGLPESEITRVKTEYDVVSTLRGLGHEVQVLGLSDDLSCVKESVETWRPHVVFNLLEEFAGEAVYDQNVVSYLELLGTPYTGCCPRGLMIARDKALSKKVMAYHGVRVPDFVVFPRGRAVRRPANLALPLFVKSLSEEASLGISQASLIEDDERLVERVAFIHDRIGTDAIAEQYIVGRELYVGMIGNHRLRVLPTWELLFTKMPEEAPRFATASAKWDKRYQERWGICSGLAQGLDETLEARIRRAARRIYRALGLTGYARIDFRLTPEGELYALEANPNPHLAIGEDFADSAAAAGLDYPALLQRIVNLGLRQAAEPVLSAC